MMNDYDALISRLGALASGNVDEALAQKHLAGLASVPAAVPQYRSRARTLVAGALVAGALAGSATMAGAMTGTLPDAAQDKVATALSKVGVDVPKGKSAEATARAAEAKAKRQADAEAGKAGKADEAGSGGTDRFLGDATTPCTLPDGTAFIGNHGDWVTAHPDDPATTDVNEREEAAKSPCGKPVQAADGSDNGKADEDHGKPATAGKSGERPSSTGKSGDTGKPTTTTTVADDDDGDTDAGTTRSGTGGGGGGGKARADR